MPSIQFKAKPAKIGPLVIIRLPKSASAKLSSRGMVMAEGTMNGFQFEAPLEPDGKGSHWFELTKAMRKGAGIEAGDPVSLLLDPMEKWPNPKIPADVKKAIDSDKKAGKLWNDVTPKARWEWIRWIRSTANPETRKKRIRVSLSKMNKGERRPCCFNQSMCTVPEVSKSGVLLE